MPLFDHLQNRYKICITPNIILYQIDKTPKLHHKKFLQIIFSLLQKNRKFIDLFFTIIN